ILPGHTTSHPNHVAWNLKDPESGSYRPLPSCNDPAYPGLRYDEPVSSPLGARRPSSPSSPTPLPPRIRRPPQMLDQVIVQQGGRSFKPHVYFAKFDEDEAAKLFAEGGPAALLSNARLDLTMSEDDHEVEVLGIMDENDEVCAYYGWSGSYDAPSYKQAMNRDDHGLWTSAMASERETLRIRDTWDPEPVPLPPGRTALPLKWVLLIKRDTEGNIVKYKARLVVRGDRQREGADFKGSLFAATACADSIRMVLALAAKNGWRIRCFDVSGAFTHSFLADDPAIFVSNAPGFPAPPPGMAYRLRRSLYGLRQAAKDWNEALIAGLKTLGFSQVPDDHGVFERVRNGKTLVIPIHVDDGLLVGDDDMDEFEREFCKLFDTTFNHNPTSFLGIRFTYDQPNHRLMVDLSGYTLRMLGRFTMSECKPADTPADPKKPLIRWEGDPIKEPYKEAIGALNFLSTWVRFDIANAVNRVSRHTANPGPDDWIAVQRIFRYLR
ncbi:hypothetical protein P7C70_g9313, partial [Phenoliferia sp. Uapishka_3]